MDSVERHVFLLLIIVILIEMVSGCGHVKIDKGEEETRQNGSDEQGIEEIVELNIWVNTRDETECSRQLRERFSRNHSNIKINVIDKTGDINAEYGTAFMAGAAPDYIGISGPMFKKYVRNGCFAPLDEYVDKWEEKDNHTDVYKEEITKYNGKTYGIVKFLGPMMFFYNKSMFKEAGINPPKTWDELIGCAVKLTDRSKNRYGYSMLLDDWLDWYLQFYVWQAGGDLTKLNSDGTIELQFTSPAVLKAVEFYRELRWKYRVIQDEMTLNHEQLVKEFAQGKSAMIIYAPNNLPWLVNLGMKKEDIGIIPMPAGPSGIPVTSLEVNLGVITANPSKAKQDAAWEWLRYANGRDSMIREMKFMEAKGVVPPWVMIYKDLKQSDIVKVDPEWEEALQAAVAFGRDEYAGKGMLTKYIVAAVHKVLFNKDADPFTELSNQQQLAQKEVIDKYNTQVKSEK